MHTATKAAILTASGLLATAYVVVAAPGSTAAPAPPRAVLGDNDCGIDAFYGEYPGTIGAASVYTKTGNCKDKITLRCSGGDLVLDYVGTGPDVEGLHPTEGESILCADVTDVFVTTGGGADVVDLRPLTESSFPDIGSLHAADDEPVEARLGGGVDNLKGSPHNDLIFGGKGNDVLRGYADADEMYGQAGDDLVSGGDGEDILSGGPGLDCVLQDPGSACAS